MSTTLSPLSPYTPKGFAIGTGIKEVIAAAQKQFALVGGLPDAVVQTLLGYMPTLFGDYPRVDKDRAACGVFIACFSVLAIANLYIWIRNLSVKQNFPLSIGLAFYCFCKALGFGLRSKWADDVLQINVGICSVVFTQVPVLFVNALTVVMAHRIFTWRHPETGHSVIFNLNMLVTYFLVLGIIAMAIIGQSIPYLYYLTPAALKRCQNVMQAAAVLEVLYCLVPFLLITLAYLFRPGTIDHRMFRKPGEIQRDELPSVVQPAWIENYGIFYFPKKGSQQHFFKDEQQGKALRIIGSREQPANGKVNVLTPEMPRVSAMSTNAIIVLLCSIILAWCSCFRVAATFQTGVQGGIVSGTTVIPLTFWVDHNYVFYIWFGAFEVVVAVILLVTRVDLRFYIPDTATKRGKNDPAPSLAEKPLYRHSTPELARSTSEHTR